MAQASNVIEIDNQSSEKIKINNVNTTEATPNHSFPQMRVTSAPTPAEPIVCAMVFNERIAPTGLSTLFLRSFKTEADFLPSCSFAVMKDIGVESRTASKTEHKKEIPKAPKRYINIINMYYNKFYSAKIIILQYLYNKIRGNQNIFLIASLFLIFTF